MQYRDGRNLEVRVRLYERFSVNPVGMHSWILAQIDLPVIASVLEVGCGVGSFWVANRERIPPACRVPLTDTSPGMVAEAERRLGAEHPAFVFGMAAAERLPLPDASFDGVFAHFMLYHVEDRPRAIHELARVLRPGGHLWAATNGARHMREARLLAMQAGLMAPEYATRGDAGNFSLENGAEQLSLEFPAVEIRRYEDHLNVTRAEPLVGYILSIERVQATLTRREPGAAERG